MFGNGIGRNRGTAGCAKRRRIIVARLENLYVVPPPEQVRLRTPLNIHIRREKLVGGMLLEKVGPRISTA